MALLTAATQPVNSRTESNSSGLYGFLAVSGLPMQHKEKNLTRNQAVRIQRSESGDTDHQNMNNDWTSLESMENLYK